MAPASDEDYAAFLDRANADPSAGRTSASASSSSAAAAKPKQFTASSVNRDVPSALSSIDRDYTSESDERFEAVSLAFDGSALRVEDVRALTGHDDVEALETAAFDPREEYRDVVDAVAQAGNGKAKVFRIGLGGARCEYWVLSVDAKGKKVVGLRAGAVES